jgi:hypothetical protein
VYIRGIQHSIFLDVVDFVVACGEWRTQMHSIFKPEFLLTVSFVAWCGLCRQQAAPPALTLFSSSKQVSSGVDQSISAVTSCGHASSSAEHDPVRVGLLVQDLFVKHVERQLQVLGKIFTRDGSAMDDSQYLQCLRQISAEVIGYRNSSC